MMSSFYVHPEDVTTDRVVLRGEEAHHAIQVRRCRKGEQIEAIDGVGTLYRVRIVRILEDAVEGEIVAREPEFGEPPVRVTLVQSLIKGDRFDFVVEKATEIGVAEIVPMVTERSVVTSRSERRIERWRRIARAAAKQSGRCRVPVVRTARRFEDALEEMRASHDLVMIAWRGERGRMMRDVVRSTPAARTAAIFVGPEGGFTEREIHLAQDAGIGSFSLGARCLRGETAGIVAVALMLYEFEGMACTVVET